MFNKWSLNDSVYVSMKNSGFFFVLIKLMYLSVDHKNICRNSVGLLVWCMIRKPNWRVFFFSWRSAVLSEVCVKRVYYIPLRFESRCSGQHIHTPIYLLCECKTSHQNWFRLIKCLQKNMCELLKFSGMSF